MNVPDPGRLHPSTRPDLTNVVFMRNQVTSPLIDVGEFTYFDDEGSGVPFERANVLYNYGPQRLGIGRYTAIAPGVTILMPAGNHPTVGPSTYPEATRARRHPSKATTASTSDSSQVVVRRR